MKTLPILKNKDLNNSFHGYAFNLLEAFFFTTSLFFLNLNNILNYIILFFVSLSIFVFSNHLYNLYILDKKVSAKIKKDTEDKLDKEDK